MYSKHCEGCGIEIVDAQRPQRRWCTDRCRKRTARSAPLIRPAPVSAPAVVDPDDLDYVEHNLDFVEAALGETVTLDVVTELLAERDVRASTQDEATVAAMLATRLLDALDGIVSAAESDPEAACALLTDAEPALRALLALVDDEIDDRVLIHLAYTSHERNDEP